MPKFPETKNHCDFLWVLQKEVGKRSSIIFHFQTHLVTFACHFFVTFFARLLLPNSLLWKGEVLWGGAILNGCVSASSKLQHCRDATLIPLALLFGISLVFHVVIFLVFCPKSLENRAKTPQKARKLAKGKTGVLCHHLKCEMKSPHLVDFS